MIKRGEKMNYGAVSIPGKVREKNEDNYLVLDREEYQIVAVADGMGGHKAGDVASSIAIEVIKNYTFKVDNIIESIRDCIKVANQKILVKSRNNPEYNGMGTTLTLGLVSNNQLVLGHIGDSRAYLYHNDSLTQLTEDHSYVADLLRKGVITEEEAEGHPKKNLLLRALGLEEDIEVDISEYKLSSEDLLLLCSDGLTNMRTDGQIISILKENLSIEEKVNNLSKDANAAGGYDNITVVLYQNN